MNTPSKSYLIQRDNLIRTVQDLCGEVDITEADLKEEIGKPTVKPFPTAWSGYSNISTLLTNIASDSMLQIGDIYIGEFYGKGLPKITIDNVSYDVDRALLKIEVYGLTGIKEYVLTLTAPSFEDTSHVYHFAPAHWEGCYYKDTEGGSYQFSGWYYVTSTLVTDVTS